MKESEPHTEIEIEAHALHVYEPTALDPSWDVWLDTEVMPRDGLIIGQGASLKLALDAAAETLRKAVKALEEVAA